jgi:prevent-host-death family protein
MNVRTVTSSEAKESFGLLLGSLADEGPVQITRNGRPVGVLSAPRERTASLDALRLTAAAALFANGQTTWQEVADETGAALGDLLLELATQGLALPRTTATKRPAQATLLSQIFQRAGRVPRA